MVGISIGQADAGFWEREIKSAVAEPDPALSNRKITQCHYHLSVALQKLLGADAGANFHSWAVWGSRKAGVTIRQEDLDQARRDGTVVGGIVGALTGLGLGWFLLAWLPWPIVPSMALFGACCGAATGRQIIVRSRRVAARLFLEGNRTVLDDIGMQTARFIGRFQAQSERDPESLAEFLAASNPGGPSQCSGPRDTRGTVIRGRSLVWRARKPRPTSSTPRQRRFNPCPKW
jgi:hypothetical protein